MIKNYIKYDNIDKFNLDDVYLIEAIEIDNYFQYKRDYPFNDFDENGKISFKNINYIGENTPFYIENRNYILENSENIDSAVDNEIRVTWLNDISTIFTKQPLYVDFGKNIRFLIEGYINDGDGYILKLDRNVDIIPEIVNIYTIDFVSEFLEYNNISSNVENGDSGFLVLTGHNTENLTNYDGYTKNNSESIVYENLNEEYNTLNDNDYEKLKPLSINIDFSNFSNHVKFGSANAKVINAEKKFISYRSKTEKSVIRNIMTSFSPFEKWLYENKYVKMSESNFNTYMENLKEMGQDYDSQNVEFIWYSVPSAILEEDSTGYFSNFLLLIGEVFDYFYTHINAMGLLKDNPHLEESMGDMFVFEELKDLGFNEEYAYNLSTFENFYKDKNAVKEVSNEIARRLLHNLPLLNNSKGTLKIIDYIFNIYGIPKNLFEIIEFTNNKRDDNISEVKYSENRYYLNIPNSSSSIDIDFSVSDFEDANNFTIEMAINNWSNTGGNILEFGDNTITFSNSGSYYGLGVITDNTSSIQTGNIIPDNNFWTYIGISKTGSAGHIYISQQDDNGYGLVNTKEFDFNYSASISTFNSMSLYPTDLASISEFKIYDRGLTEKEFRDHAKDFKSVAEIKGQSTLNLYKSFSKPETGSVSCDNGLYNVTYNNINISDFAIDEFFSFTDIKLFDQEYGGNKITFGKITYDGDQANLSSTEYNATYTDLNKNDDPNRLGIFVSPTEKINKQIFRKIIDDADLIPVPYKDPNSYQYTDLNNEIMELSDIDPKYSDMYYYYYLQNLLSGKLFRLINHFMPANTDLEMGLLIQNNVLRKNKYPNGEKFMSTRLGLDGEIIGDVEEYSINVVKEANPIESSISESSSERVKEANPIESSISESSSERVSSTKFEIGGSTESNIILKLDSTITIREKNRYSVYLNTIETNNVISGTVFGKNMYKSSKLNAVATAFENLDDAGASIQIN